MAHLEETQVLVEGELLFEIAMVSCCLAPAAISLVMFPTMRLKLCLFYEACKCDFRPVWVINAFLTQFSGFIQGYGPAWYALFVAVYAGLEILAIPAIPLTMTAGLLFGSYVGSVSCSFFARERILKMVEGNKKFLAIDKAIGENGFRIVTLLRLSPLLPFSLGNYLYGLTSVKFVPYVLGSWMGMLPGTWAYVSAGAFGRAIIQEESDVRLHG